MITTIMKIYTSNKGSYCYDKSCLLIGDSYASMGLIHIFSLYF